MPSAAAALGDPPPMKQRPVRPGPSLRTSCEGAGKGVSPTEGAEAWQRKIVCWVWLRSTSGGCGSSKSVACQTPPAPVDSSQARRRSLPPSLCRQTRCRRPTSSSSRDNSPLQSHSSSSSSSSSPSSSLSSSSPSSSSLPPSPSRSSASSASSPSSPLPSLPATACRRRALARRCPAASSAPSTHTVIRSNGEARPASLEPASLVHRSRATGAEPPRGRREWKKGKPQTLTRSGRRAWEWR